VFRRGLAKEPDERPESCGALVAELAQVLQQDESATLVATGAPATPPTTAITRQVGVHTSRRRMPLALVGLAAVALGGVGLGWALSSGSDGGQRVVTRVTQRTVAGQARVETVTVTQPAGPAADANEGEGRNRGNGNGKGKDKRNGSAVEDGRNAADLNDAGYRLLQNGDAASALPLLERAVSALQGTGSITEAYASYNLAWARFATGTCDGVLELLDRSQQVQGHRTEIDRLRAQAERRC
jgi:hypothetical protein